MKEPWERDDERMHRQDLIDLTMDTPFLPSDFPNRLVPYPSGRIARKPPNRLTDGALEILERWNAQIDARWQREREERGDPE